jgi:hypothetical protein
VVDKLDEKQICKLIHDRQIVSNGHLVLSYDQYNPESFRLLDNPLAIYISDELIRGSWTVKELAEKIGIQDNDIRNVLIGLMRDPSPFEGGYIPRRIGRDITEGHKINFRYSFISIPINARIFDPLLGFSLLGWQSLLKEFDGSSKIIQTSDLNNRYCQKISSFWDISLQKVQEYYSKKNNYFIPSVYGILPVLENEDIYSAINKKIGEPPDLLSVRFRRRHLKKEHLLFSRYLIQGPGSIPELQYYIVFLHDILSYCSSQNLEHEYYEFSKINLRLFQKIFNLLEESPLKSEHSDLPMIKRCIPENPDSIPENWINSVENNLSQQNLVVNKYIQEFKSGIVNQRVSTIRKINSGKAPADINLLTLALNDEAWTVQFEALTVIQNQIISINPTALIPCIKSSNKRVRRAAIFILSTIGTLEALKLLEKIAIRCDRILAKQAIHAIANGNYKNSKQILEKIFDLSNNPQIRNLAFETLKKFHSDEK